MEEDSNKERILRLIRENPFVSQQELAEKLKLSRSAVATHIAQLTREQRILGRAYLLPDSEPILVIGGANVDRKAKSIAPVVMGTSNPMTVNESYGGVGRNVAENLSRLGLPVRLMTAVGDDAQGSALLKHARDLGIDTGASLTIPGIATGTYTAVLQPDGEMLLAVSDMAAVEQLTPKVLINRRSHWRATRTRVVDLNLPPATLATLIEDSHQHGSTLIAVAVSEPKMNRLPDRLDGLSLIILNQGELAARMGRDLPHHGAVMAACRGLQAQGAREVVVTLGAEGVIHTCGSDAPRFLPVQRRSVVDVTGAGDAFSAGVVASLVRHPGDLHLACQVGQQLAELTLSTHATVVPSLTPAFLQGAESAVPA